MVKFSSIPMKPSPAPSVRSSSASPNSARHDGVWLWFCSEGLSFPLQTKPAGRPGPIRWVSPTYHALHQVLTHPVYAGAYTYGKTRFERYVDEQGVIKKRTRHLPRNSGLFSSRTSIPASSIGQPLKPIR